LSRGAAFPQLLESPNAFGEASGVETSQRRVRVIRKDVSSPSAIYRAMRVGFLVVIVLVALAVAWRWKGEGIYLRWTKTRQIIKAEQLFRAGKLAEAGAAARRVVDIDPSNLRAVRLVAVVADQFGIRDAVLWRERAAELEPWNTTNLIDWSQSALRYGDYFTALRALSRYPTNPPPPAYFHDTAGTVALGVGDRQQADFHFSEAVRLDPTNITRQFNLAKLRLFAEGAIRQEEARQQLKRLADMPQHHNEALALLAEDALIHSKWADANRFAAELMTQTNITFADRLLQVRALQAAKSPAYTNALQSLQAYSVKNPSDLARLIIWLNESGQAPLAMNWVRTLTAETRLTPAVSMAIADLFISLRDWLGLRRWVHDGDWAGLNCFRFAYDAYAARFLNGSDKGGAELDGLWSKAMTAAAGNTSQLEQLAQIATRWGLSKQAENTWWAVAESGKGVENALLILQRGYLLRDDTLGQFRVAKQFHLFKPNDLSALNNLVYLGLLLKVDDSNLQKLADRLYEQSHNNPIHIATYAFALFRRDQAQAAADLMNSLDPLELRRPAIAAMQGVFLAKAGDTLHARDFLKLANQAKLLPEEEKLVNEARAQVRLR
jgi:tetratricopeptide (TPR) repeat protein